MVFPPDAGVSPLPWPADLPDTGVVLLGPVLPDDDVGVKLLAWLDRPVLAFRETGVTLLGWVVVVVPLGGVNPLGGVSPLGGVLPRAVGLCFVVSASGLVALSLVEVAAGAWW